jgi:hypothetical protein
MISQAQVALSRRAGRVMTQPPIAELSMDRRGEFVRAVAAAASFEDLPAWARELILRCEYEQRP